MKINFVFILCPLLFLWIGCSNTTPQIGMLTNINSGLEFSPALITTSTWSSVGIAGKCSSFVDSVDLSFDGGQTWYSSQALDSGASGCGTGTFSMTLSNSVAPLNTLSFVSGQITDIKFKTHTKFNTEATSLLQVQFTPVSQHKQQVLIGSATATDGGSTMTLKGRATMTQQTLATGGGYQLRGWVR